ncbi:unnamed protein product [Lasius platythorax]|uniref:C2H2-type domain-containing protein n=1 Tax=Lasius platythorax TaxID=488582 RepID=A0AAV2NIF1_9HYME
MMLAAATLYWSQSTGVHRQSADHCRLSCPSCGRNYKYRSGLRSHIAECLSEREKLEADFRWQRQQQQQQWENQPAGSYRQQQRQPLTAKDIRVLYKFWKS